MKTGVPKGTVGSNPTPSVLQACYCSWAPSAPCCTCLLQRLLCARTASVPPKEARSLAMTHSQKAPRAGKALNGVAEQSDGCRVLSGEMVPTASKLGRLAQTIPCPFLNALRHYDDSTFWVGFIGNQICRSHSGCQPAPTRKPHRAAPSLPLRDRPRSRRAPARLQASATWRWATVGFNISRAPALYA